MGIPLPAFCLLGLVSTLPVASAHSLAAEPVAGMGTMVGEVTANSGPSRWGKIDPSDLSKILLPDRPLLVVWHFQGWQAKTR